MMSGIISAKRNYDYKSLNKQILTGKYRAAHEGTIPLQGNPSVSQRTFLTRAD
jgi:hypothetical protein